MPTKAQSKMVLVPNGEVGIDLDLIPEYVRQDLARATIKAVNEFFAQPGVEEKYQAWLAEQKAAEAAKREAALNGTADEKGEDNEVQKMF